MTINTKKFFNENELPDLPGLGGGGGGTDAITGKAKTKTIGNYMKDAFKISTIPARFLLGIKSPEDPLSKFAAPSTPEDKVSSAISSYNQSVRPDLTEQNNMKNISTNINQDVDQSGGVTTVIQRQVRTVTVPVSIPTPVPSGKGKNRLVPVPVSVNNNSIAKIIR